MCLCHAWQLPDWLNEHEVREHVGAGKASALQEGQAKNARLCRPGIPVLCPEGIVFPGGTRAGILAVVADETA